MNGRGAAIPTMIDFNAAKPPNPGTGGTRRAAAIPFSDCRTATSSTCNNIFPLRFFPFSLTAIVLSSRP